MHLDTTRHGRRTRRLARPAAVALASSVLVAGLSVVVTDSAHARPSDGGAAVGHGVTSSVSTGEKRTFP